MLRSLGRALVVLAVPMLAGCAQVDGPIGHSQRPDVEEIEPLLEQAARLGDEERALFDLGPRMLTIGSPARARLRGILLAEQAPLPKRAFAAFFVSLFEREEDFWLFVSLAEDTSQPEDLRLAAAHAGENMLLGKGQWQSREGLARDNATEALREFQRAAETARKRGFAQYWLQVLDDIYRDERLPSNAPADDLVREEGDLAFGYHMLPVKTGVPSTAFPALLDRTSRARWYWEGLGLMATVALLANDPDLLGIPDLNIGGVMPGSLIRKYHAWKAQNGERSLEELVIRGFQKRGYRIDRLDRTCMALSELVSALGDRHPIVRANAKWQLNRLTGHYFILDKGYGFKLNVGGYWEKQMSAYPLQPSWRRWLKGTAGGERLC